jgi:hypothetical protein
MAVTHSRPPWTARPQDLPTRLAGALLGAWLSAVAADLQSSFDLWWSALRAVPLGTIGVVAGAVVGFLTARRAVSAARPVPVAFRAAVHAVVLGVALVAANAALRGAGSGEGHLGLDSLVGLGALLVGGLVVALPISLPIALISVAALRRGRFGVPRARRLRVIAVVLAAAAVLALGGRVIGRWDAAAGSPNLASGSIFRSDGIRLSWTVTNRGRDALELSVWNPTSDGGASGWSEIIPACFTTTGASTEGAHWFIALKVAHDADTDIAAPLEQDGIVSAEDFPGANPAVWIDFEANGSTSVHPDPETPTSEQLVTPQC